MIVKPGFEHPKVFIITLHPPDWLSGASKGSANTTVSITVETPSLYKSDHGRLMRISLECGADCEVRKKNRSLFRVTASFAVYIKDLTVLRKRLLLFQETLLRPG